jgi:hypothetical protein
MLSGIRRLPAAAVATLLVAPGLVAGPPPASAASASKPTFQAACDTAKPGSYQCFALRRTDVAATPVEPGVARPATTPYGFGPADLASAYGLPGGTAGDGMVVAIVDAYDDPTAESDLATYRAQYGLPACTTANGCFRKVDQNGGTTYPQANAGWAGEISLDVDMVSAACPACHILLVEANTSAYGDLGTAVNRAVAMGAVAVSNSYGGPESSYNSAFDSMYFDHPGVAITASTGDCGYRCDGFQSTGVAYPAASEHVVAVGGTTLKRAANARGWTETAWGSATSKWGAGSGCSAYSSKPAWQLDASCANRMQADVSAVADPATGVAVYNTGNGGWAVYGGTSASAPIIASIYAMATPASASAYPASYLYNDTADFNDVVGGSNDVWGTCAITYYCTAVAGYDGPTGLGSPKGVAAFGPTAATLPGKPLSVSATTNTSASAIVSWALPATGGHPTSFKATSSSGNKSCTAAGALTCTITGLTNGTTYTFSVTATNSAGTGPASDPSNSVTPSARPGAPTGVLAGLSGTSAQVSWNAAAGNGSTITRYTVTSSPDNLTCTWTSGPLACTVGGLKNLTSYTFTVTATNSWGAGPASDPSNSVMLSIWNIGLEADKTNATLGAGVTLTATANANVGPTDYWIVILDTSDSVMTVCGDGTSCSTSVSSVSSATMTYHAVVGDRFGGSAVARSEEVRVDWTAAGTPGRPTGMGAVAGDGSAVITWSAPGVGGSSPITTYIVTSSTDTRQCNWTSGPLTCTVSGLTNGKRYTFTAIARNDAGDSLASDPSAAVIPQMAPEASTYHAITPARVLDTRPGTSNIGLKNKFVAGTVRTFGVAGVHFVGGGTSVAVPSGAVAVTGNLTVTGQTAPGVIALGPATTASGTATTLNFGLAENRANNVTLALGPGGNLSAVYRSATSGATVDLIFDVTGYFTADSSGATYQPLAPGRVLDTRSGAGHIGLAGKFLNRTVRTIGVVGVKGIGWTSARVPANATAVTANLTITNASSDGYVAIGPTMTGTPSTSTVNTKKAKNTANGVTVALKGGKLAAVWVGAAGSGADVILDITGYFTADATGLHFYGLSPYRVLNSSGRFSSGSPQKLALGGSGSLPAGSKGIAGNLTVAGPSSNGYAFVAPSITGSPSSSTVNASAGLDAANGFDVGLDATGHLMLVWCGTAGSTAGMALDISGYWM